MGETLVNHIEEYLGPIEKGWIRSPQGEKLSFQVVKCTGGYMAKTNAFCTVGLSNYPLLSRVSDKTIWQELLILTPESFGERNIPAVLRQLGSAGLTHRSAFLCGELIERENAIFGDLPFYGFVAAIPVTLPDEFSTYTAKDGRQIIFAWMVPVTKAEAAIVRKEGWGKLEDMFVAQETDLVALDRSGII